MAPENACKLQAAVVPPQWWQEPQVQTSHDGDDLGCGWVVRYSPFTTKLPLVQHVVIFCFLSSPVSTREINSIYSDHGQFCCWKSLGPRQSRTRSSHPCDTLPATTRFVTRRFREASRLDVHQYWIGCFYLFHISECYIDQNRHYINMLNMNQWIIIYQGRLLANQHWHISTLRNQWTHVIARSTRHPQVKLCTPAATTTCLYQVKAIVMSKVQRNKPLPTKLTIR